MAPSATQHSLWGITLILLGTFSAAVMFLLVKLLSDLNTFSLVFYRGFFQAALSLIMLRHDGTRYLFGNGSRVVFLLFLRAAFGAAAVCAWFYGAQILPLPDAVTLQFTTPPFSAAFAVIIVGEPWLKLDIIGAVVCLTGVALIAHPTWLFGSENDDSDETIVDSEENKSSILLQALAVLITTAGSALAGLAYVCVRVIGDRAPAIVMVLYYGLISIPVALFGSAIFEGTWDVVRGGRDNFFSLKEWILIILIGVLGHVGQWLINLGLQRETAATATLATCTQIVWTYIFELAFLHETLNHWSLIGTGLILGYMFVVAWTKIDRGSNRDKGQSAEAEEGVATELKDDEAVEVTPLLQTNKEPLERTRDKIVPVKK